MILQFHPFQVAIVAHGVVGNYLSNRFRQYEYISLDRKTPLLDRSSTGHFVTTPVVEGGRASDSHVQSVLSDTSKGQKKATVSWRTPNRVNIK